VVLRPVQTVTNERGPIRLLLVEDNPGDALIFRETLAGSRLETTLVHVQRLREALDILSEQEVDLILVDLSLPDAQDTEAVAKIRAIAPAIPLIVLTGLDDAAMAARAKQLGAVDYLVKWFVDSNSLARYIWYAIEQYRMYGTSNPPTPEGLDDPQESEDEEIGLEVPDVGAPLDSLPPEPVAAPMDADREPQQASGEALNRDDEALRGLASAGTGVVVLYPGGGIKYASRVAEEHLGPASRMNLSWISRPGYHRTKVPRPLDLHVAASEWEGEPAWAILVRPAEHVDASAPGDLLQVAHAVLNHLDQSIEQNRWMAEVLRDGVDQHRVLSTPERALPESLDMVALAQQVLQEVRRQALRLGIPVRMKTDRKKLLCYTERTAIERYMHRVMEDAIYTADPVGVEVRIGLDGEGGLVEIVWEPQAVTVNADAATLGQRVAAQWADLAGGKFRSGNVAGRCEVRVTLPLPE
jgi:CheY-like chemotaxis protein